MIGSISDGWTIGDDSFDGDLLERLPLTACMYMFNKEDDEDASRLATSLIRVPSR